MNYPIAIAGCLTALAFLAHIFGGIRETLSTAPERLAEKTSIPNFETVERNWVQSVCAFQLVTVDLLVLSTLLFVLVFTDIIEPKKWVALALAAFYALWGVAWLVQLLALKRRAKDFLLLGHWLFWFGCAGLIFWGAQSL